MFFCKKSSKQTIDLICSIPKGWLVRQISQDPLDGSWMGMLFRLEPTYDGGCLYVEAVGLSSFECLVNTLIHRIESGKGIKNTNNDKKGP